MVFLNPSGGYWLQLWYLLYAGLPTAADDKAEIKDARKQLMEKGTEVARLQAELDHAKRNVALDASRSRPPSRKSRPRWPSQQMKRSSAARTLQRS